VYRLNKVESILYINSLRACVCLSDTTFCTGNLRGRFCNPSLCPFVRSFVCPSVHSSVCPDVFFSPSFKLSVHLSLKIRYRQNRFVCMYVCILREKEIQLRMSVRPSVCPFICLSIRLSVTVRLSVRLSGRIFLPVF